MTKVELIAKLAEDSKVTKKTAATMLESLIKTLQEGLKSGDSIRINGLGTFAVGDRKERNGVNPRTGEKMQIPAMKVPVFRASKVLKESVKPVPKKGGKKKQK